MYAVTTSYLGDQRRKHRRAGRHFNDLTVASKACRWP